MLNFFGKLYKYIFKGVDLTDDTAEDFVITWNRGVLLTVYNGKMHMTTKAKTAKIVIGLTSKLFLLLYDLKIFRMFYSYVL